jgi:hypothetical protein
MGYKLAPWPLGGSLIMIKRHSLLVDLFLAVAGCVEIITTATTSVAAAATFTTSS